MRTLPRVRAAVHARLVPRGCSGRLVAGCATVGGGPATVGGKKQDPPGVDEAGVGEGASPGLWPAVVERIDLMPAFPVAEAAGGDVPQVVPLHYVVLAAMRPSQPAGHAIGLGAYLERADSCGGGGP